MFKIKVYKLKDKDQIPKMGYKVCHTLARSTLFLSSFQALRSFCLPYRSTLFSLTHLYIF